MKKLLSVLALVLAISALLCVGVFAESTGEPTIDYGNLVFNDAVAIRYAVKSESSDTKLLLWTSPQDEYTADNAEKTISSWKTQTIRGESYKVFTYYGISAKQMTDDVYVRAYVQSSDS